VSAPPRSEQAWPAWVRDAVADAGGRRAGAEPGGRRTGGPAGNATLTAWLGLTLVVALLAELVTLLDVRGLLGWHAGIGAVVAALVVVKVAVTGWKAVRYYTGSPSYRSVGPPSLVFRVLGPLVVLSALGVLGTGFALVALGADASHRRLVAVAGQRVDAVTLHQATFVVFAVLVSLHALGRIVPAATRVAGAAHHRVHGGWLRAGVLVVTAAVAVLGVVLVLPAAAGWR
jgi:hypothetical protein